MAGVDDKADFVAWLGGLGSAASQYALIRHHNGILSSGNKANMSGHFHSAFFGIRAFLRSHPAYQGRLRQISWSNSFWQTQSQLEHDFKQFVRANWASFPGQRGGNWQKKLPLRLGGLPSKGGGRGSGLISRMLILLDRYGHQFGY
jgi:hypothetical protein